MSSTNKTTNYELSQYVGTDKPTYLGDYNGDMLKIDTQMKSNHDLASSASSAATAAGDSASSALSKATTNESSIGTLSNLKTSAKTSLVASVNELVDTKDVYSTTETVIGSWLGKPLYRKVFEIPKTAFNAGQEVSTGNYQIAYSTYGISSVEAVAPNSNILFVRNTSPVRYMPLPIVDPVYPAAWNCYVNFMPAAMNIILGTSAVTGFRDATAIYCILEYTKTTD